MENEGIMALPQGGAMQNEMGEQPPAVTSLDSYDAAQTALGMVNPQQLAELKATLRENMGDLQLTPGELSELIEAFEYLSQNPREYGRTRQFLIEQDLIDAEDLPEQYDPEFLGAALAVLNELRMMMTQGAQAPMMSEPPVEGMQPMGFAQGGLADVASYLASQGRNGDTMLAHITPEEAQLLMSRGGAGTINPVTGLPEFFKKFFKSVGKAVKSVVKGVTNVVKSVLKSPVGRVLATVALATVLGPAGIGLSMGTAAGLAGAGTTLAAGGSLKDALIAGAMGYVGGGGTIMGVSPVSAVGQYLPGAAGSALNTGLATGAIGTGVGLVAGMDPQQALQMGMTSGLSAAALQGISNSQQAQLLKDAQFAQQNGLPLTAQQQAALDAANAAAAPAAGAQPGADGGVGQVGPVGTAQDVMAMTPPGGAGNMISDTYNQYLSPNRPGLPEDAGLIRRYAPLAVAGTAAMGAFGGFEGQPALENPAFDRNYTGMEYIQDNPDRFRGGLDSPALPPRMPGGSVVPTPSYGSIPMGTPGSITPAGITRSPGGVAQPYNVAGLYGVPLLYGQQPRGYAKGGELRPEEFPRKTGPINGPGTGTSDSIPAMLSDGEFVFTAKAVRNAGNGSRRKGAARMYKIMKMLEGGPVKANTNG